MNKKRAVLLLVLITFIFYFQRLPVFSKETPVKITAENNNQNIDFYIENQEICDITITLDFTSLDNLSSTVSLPYTGSVKQGEKIKALSLSINDRKTEYSYKYKYHYIYGSMYAKHDDSYIYSLPYSPGSSYYVAQGYNGSFSHFGDEAYSIDWFMPEGTPVCAARGGIVIATRDDSNQGGPDQSYKGSANYVYIIHSDGTIASYLHLMQDSVDVPVGQRVDRGDIIGLSGNTGYSTDPHLHFCVYKPLDGTRFESIPIKFKTSDSPSTTLEEGNYYTAK